MPAPLNLILIAIAVLCGSGLILLAIGRRFGMPLAGTVASVACVSAFVLALVGLMRWLSGGSTEGRLWGPETVPIAISGTFLSFGSGETAQGLETSLYFDSLTGAMAVLVGLVSTLVHIFSIGYMRGEVAVERAYRFFAVLNLFTAGMLGLVISGSLWQYLLAFEWMGVCSYLLISHWYERRAARSAGFQAMLLNRVGDAGFLLAIALLIALHGTTQLTDLWRTGISGTVGTVIGLGLVAGAIGKSAQFPLNQWLVDAMEGPTPASALLHAATMVAAGVYMVVRCYPLLDGTVLAVVGVAGAVSVVAGGIGALLQNDFKRVLACSTVSQLGLMMAALALGGWSGGLMLLFTHAFAKAALFLAAGSVIATVGHQADVRGLGGLVKKLPATGVFAAVAVCVLAGVPWAGGSGAWTKGAVLDAVGSEWVSRWSGQSGVMGWVAGATVSAVIVGVYLTPAYLARVWWLVFAGHYRWRDDPAAEPREHSTMAIPLAMLAVMAWACGNASAPVRDLVEGARKEMAAVHRSADDSAAPAKVAAGAGSAAVGGWAGFDRVWPLPDRPVPVATDNEDTEAGAAVVVTPVAVERGHTWVAGLTHYAWLVGVLVGVGLAHVQARRVETSVAAAGARWRDGRWRKALASGGGLGAGAMAVWLGRGVLSPLGAVVSWLDVAVIDGLVRLAGGVWGAVARGVASADRRVIDGAVAGVSATVWRAGDGVASPGRGRVRAYIIAAAAGVLLLGGLVLAVWWMGRMGVGIGEGSG